MRMDYLDRLEAGLKDVELAKDRLKTAAANLEIATSELLGPEAHKQLMALCGNRESAAGQVQSALDSLGQLTELAKGAAKSSRTLSEWADKLVFGIEQHYEDVLGKPQKELDFGDAPPQPDDEGDGGDTAAAPAGRRGKKGKPS